MNKFRRVSCLLRLSQVPHVALMGLLGTGEAKPGQGAAAGGGEDWNVRTELGSVSVGGMGPFRRDLPPLTELWKAQSDPKC